MYNGQHLRSQVLRKEYTGRSPDPQANLMLYFPLSGNNSNNKKIDDVLMNHVCSLATVWHV